MQTATGVVDPWAFAAATAKQTKAPADVSRFDWERAIREAGLGLSATAVALTLATYSDSRTGANVRPSLRSLSERIGAGYSTVRSGRDSLVQRGWLVVVRRGDRAKHQPDEFHLSIPENFDPLPAPGRGSASPEQGVCLELVQGVPATGIAPASTWHQSVQIQEHVPEQTSIQIDEHPEVQRLREEAKDLEREGHWAEANSRYTDANELEGRWQAELAELADAPGFD